MKTTTNNSFRVLVLFLFLMLIGFGSLHAQFSMGNTLAPLAGNPYPIVYSNDVMGGFHQVATIAARNAIPALRRQAGMLCTVLDAGSGTPKTYQLLGGILDANWVEFTSGATTIEADPIVKAINGIVKSNGTTISAAVAGTDYLSPTGSAATLTSFPILNQNTTGNAATVTTNANLTGEVTSVGNAATLTNASVIGKVLTGYTSGAGTVVATDNILQAIQKLNGNSATISNLTGMVTSSGNTTTVVTNANLTGPITSSGNATSVASQTGTGSTFVMNTSPVLITPNLGTPTTLVGTNITGTAAGLTAGSVTNNANLTGEVTSVGNAATVTNAAVIGKVLTGYVRGSGAQTVAATDNILQAIQKLDGNVVAASNGSWNLTGNAGTTASTNFIGTTDNVDVAFKRNGVQSGLLNSTNTSFGVSALNPVTTGTNNVATGSMALTANTTGNNNTATGSGALSSNVAGSGGVAIGYYSQQYANNKTFAWPNKNTSVGAQSLQGSTTASANIGNGNTALGYQTLMNNTSGNSNVATGNNALQSNTTGGFNTAIGTSALFVNLSGIYNTALGGLAGYGDGTTAAQQSIIDNNATFVGYQASRDIVPNTTALTNITAIGYMAKVSQNNSLILGGTGANAVSVGIGNTAPDASAVLDVTSTTKGALLPRVTTGQKMLIVTPAAGLIVYDNTLNQLQVYNGSSWGAAAASGWNLTGTAGTTAGTNFIGTTDDVDVVFKRNGVQSGLLNNALANTSFGVLALNPGTTGINNTALGYQALKHNTTGSYNIGTGLYALSSNTTGGTNVATGAGALFSNVAGSSGVAIGNNSQYYANNTATSWINTNTSVGTASLQGSATAANNTGIDNTAVGYQTMLSNTTGYQNTASGLNALLSNTTGYNNTANGANALYSDVAGSNGVAIGNYSQYYANNTTTAWTNYNTSVGYQSLQGSTTASANTGNYNTALGYQSLQNNTTGANNTATGYSALNINTTGGYNVATGYYALAYNSTGAYNVAIGNNVLQNNSTGKNNTATGMNVLFSNLTGSYNVANGNNALNTNTTGSNNSAIGNLALSSNVAGSNGVALGYNSQYYANNTATPWTNSNTSVGYQSLQGSATAANNTGLNNTALGYQTLMNNTTGNNNVATGLNALSANTTGSGNVANGTSALIANTIGGNNVATGTSALQYNTTGSANVASGANALVANTTGTGNTALGFAAGYTDGTTVTPAALTNATAIGYYAQVTASNSVVLGGTGTYAANVGIGTTAPAYKLDVVGSGQFSGNLTVNGNLSTPSDIRLKTKIETLTDVLAKLEQLRGVTYEFKDQQKYAKGPQVGVIAQELQKVFPELVMTDAKGYLSVNYSQLTAVLIQAVKEQQQEIDLLRKQMDRVMKKLGLNE